jgi:hypothetical protein
VKQCSLKRRMGVLDIYNAVLIFLLPFCNRARAKKLVGIKNIDGEHFLHLPCRTVHEFTCQSRPDRQQMTRKLIGAVYAMGFYMDENAAKQTCDKDFSCLPPASLEQNQALAERK